ncbi:MAG: sodium:proton antiporter [Coriobacteriales bacterium]|jgi:CPA1 family monovalent cation:H+ antiporter|nr:sodium:proton antiporter [Coriobacteriales bacterium]
MVGAVLVSNFLSVQFPRVSTPLVQIALGMGLTLLPINFEIDFDPELFMVLFIAPLLFEDAKKVNKPALWRLKWPVLSLALGLVFLTVLVLGFSLHFFAPSIPLAAAFALAAALAPTDAVSVSSLKQNATISTEQDLLLKGEALLNDASSIVSFQFAIAAVLTGSFSLLAASLSFFVMFFGGLVLGLGLMLARYVSLRFLRARGIDNIPFHVLFEIITPFLVFLIAELLGVSGIIAVVAAGITHSFAPRVVTPSAARLNIVSTSVWRVISFTLNGLVFLILGTQLPYLAAQVWTGTTADISFWLLLITVTLAVILTLRFVWMLVLQRNINVADGSVTLAFDEHAPLPMIDLENECHGALTPAFGSLNAQEREQSLEKIVAAQRRALMRQARQHKAERRAASQAEKTAARADKHYWQLHLKDALLLSLTGVKGAITLAILLTIPLTLNTGSPFPERDLLLFLASCVIVLSLLLANVLVPLIAPKKKSALHPLAEIQAILDIYRTVVRQLPAQTQPQQQMAVADITNEYYKRMSALKKTNALDNPHEQAVYRYIIELERAHTANLLSQGRISILTGIIYLNQLSRRLARVEHHSALGWEARGLWEQMRRWLQPRRSDVRPVDGESKESTGDHGAGYVRHRAARLWLRDLLIENTRFALDRLTEDEQQPGLPKRPKLPKHTIELATIELRQRLNRWEAHNLSDPRQSISKTQATRLRVETLALDLERNVIKNALEQGRISAQTAKTLQDNVTIMELDIEAQLSS